MAQLTVLSLKWKYVNEIGSFHTGDGAGLSCFAPFVFLDVLLLYYHCTVLMECSSDLMYMLMLFVL